MAQQIVHRCQVKVHLTRELRHKLRHLQVYDHKAAQAQVIEQQINLIVLAADFQMILTAYEGKACSHFQQETLQMRQQPFFELTLMRVPPSVKKSKL